MTDTQPKFAEDARKCAGDSGRREAGGKDFAKQKAEGQGCGSSRCQFVENRAERGGLSQTARRAARRRWQHRGAEVYAKV
jgi:hypothetical protein